VRGRPACLTDDRRPVGSDTSRSVKPPVGASGGVRLLGESECTKCNAEEHIMAGPGASGDTGPGSQRRKATCAAAAPQQAFNRETRPAEFLGSAAKRVPALRNLTPAGPQALRARSPIGWKPELEGGATTTNPNVPQLRATAKPRCTPGRAISDSYHRLTLGKSAKSI
jgi:hypothetical protein